MQDIIDYSSPLVDLHDGRDAEELVDEEEEPNAIDLFQSNDQQRLDRDDLSPERPHGAWSSPPPSNRDGRSPEPTKSPGKYWSISETTETPEGIKMKINRKKKPSQQVDKVSGSTRRTFESVFLHVRTWKGLCLWVNSFVIHRWTRPHCWHRTRGCLGEGPRSLVSALAN